MFLWNLLFEVSTHTTQLCLTGLNPCFCGTCFLRYQHHAISGRVLSSLNPCFCGTCFLSGLSEKPLLFFCSSLNPCFCGTCFLSPSTPIGLNGSEMVRLNPCFCGTCFLSTSTFLLLKTLFVLILVFVELAF